MKFYINKNIIFDQFAILTIGVPFGCFKLLLGLVSIKILPSPFNEIVGFTMIFWGSIDLIINCINLLMLLFKDEYLIDLCLLTILFSRKSRHSERLNKAWKEFGTAMDVMMSFTIVAIMVGYNLFPYLTRWESWLWNISVVINVLGAGLSRIIISYIQVQNKSFSDPHPTTS